MMKKIRVTLKNPNSVDNKFRLTENRIVHFLARLILGIIIIGLPIMMFTILTFDQTFLSTIILMVMFLLFFCVFIL